MDALQQVQAADTAVGFIAVGKQHPDIPEGSGAKEGIYDGVEQNIGVGMPLEAKPVIYLYPAEDAGTPFGKGVNIVADTHSQTVNGHGDAP